MKVKVYCPCGARFEFEVEPVHERMPVPINCPTCGADATELANEIIRHQLAAPQAGAVPAETPPPASAPPATGLRIARMVPAHAPEASAESSAPATAPRPMPQRPVTSAAPARQTVRSRDELSPLLRTVIMGVVAILLLTAAAWFWYVWFGRDPKVVYSLDFPKSSRADAFYELIAPGRLLSVKNQHVTLMDAAQQIPLWSVPVPAGADDSYLPPRVIISTNDIWVAWSAQLMRIDRQSGAQKQLSIPDPIVSIASGDHMILVLSGNSSTNQVVTQFSLPDGAAQTEEIAPSTRSNAPGNPAQTGVIRESAAASAPAQNTSGLPGAVLMKNLSFQPRANLDRAEMSFDDQPLPLFDAGPNAVWFQTRLLERREIRREAMKKPAGKSILDNPNVTASQGLDLAEEMANNAQRERTGGVDIMDVSRYQVTLHRLFAHDVSDWTGEVVGPPELVPLKTIDLIVAGTNILAFDKNNKKLWDAKLTFPYSSGHGFEQTGPPVLETGDALYFADKGMLTRFDPATGNVRWRLTSVGISAVQVDDRGRLYLDTTTLRPDAIQYSQQINLHDRDLRVIMQVDPATGNILWRSDFPGSNYHCLVSGKFLYSSRVWQTQDALRLEEGPDTHFTFKLLQPASGKMIWNHVLDNKHLVKAEVQQNWILLQFEDQVAVMKFFSL